MGMEPFTEEMGFDLGLDVGRIYLMAELPDKTQQVQSESQINLK